MPTAGIRIGVFASALSADPRITAKTAREIGFAGVQFDAVSFGIDLTTLSASGLRELRGILSSQDRELIGFRADAGLKGLSLGADVDRVIDKLVKVMETAAGMGSPLVCIELGPLPAAPVVEEAGPKPSALDAGLIILPDRDKEPPKPPRKPTPPPDPAFVSQVNAAMAEIGRHADRYSVVLAFRSDLASFASLEVVLRDASCPWFGVDLDPVSVLRDEWDLDELFSRMGPLVRHVRGRDAVGGAERRTKSAIVGQGSVEWEALLANLEQAGYHGWITVDPSDLTDRASAARSGYKYLKSLIP